MARTQLQTQSPTADPERTDQVLRRQLEGAVETLETARDAYHHLLTALEEPHWAGHLVLRPELIASAIESEARVHDAGAAVERRTARGDIAPEDLPVAAEVLSLRRQIEELARRKCKATEQADLPSVLSELARAAASALTIVKKHWWAPGRATLQLTMHSPPRDFLVELAQAANAVHTAPLDIDVRLATDGEAGPVVEIRENAFQVSWYEMGSGGRREGPLCQMIGSIQEVGPGSVVSARVSVSARSVVREMAGTLIALSILAPAVLRVPFAVKLLWVPACVAVSLGVWVWRFENRGRRHTEHLLEFAQRAGARCQGPGLLGAKGDR